MESTVGVGSEFWIELIRDVTPQLVAKNTLSAEHTPQTQINTKRIAALRTLLMLNADRAMSFHDNFESALKAENKKAAKISGLYHFVWRRRGPYLPSYHTVSHDSI